MRFLNSVGDEVGGRAGEGGISGQEKERTQDERESIHPYGLSMLHR